MFKRFLSIFITILLISISIVGCGSAKEESAKKEDNKKATRSKDELVLAIGTSEPAQGFDPTTGWGSYGSPLFQSTIFKRDNNFNLVNDLAKEHEISADGRVWTIKIRDDVKFTDNTPLTAKDIVYTYETAAKTASIVDLNDLEKVEAIDDHTVKFTLKQPQSTFVVRLTNIGIVPQHLHKQGYAENPVGSGPFKFVQWDKGQQLIVEANKDYYGNKSPFKKITFLFLDEDAAYGAAKAKEVDMAYIPATFAKNPVEGMKLINLKTIDNRGILFPSVKSGQKDEQGYDIGNDVTSDISIRKAINIALDRKKLVSGVLEGYGSPAFSVCDNMPWWNKDNVFEDGKIDEAKKILADAGWKDTNSDGILEKGSLKASINLIYPSNDQIRQSLAISCADTLKTIGIEVNPVSKSWDEIKTVMHKDPVLFGWGSYNPIELYNIYYSKNAGIEWFNSGFYKNDKVDGYLEKALHSKTEAEAIEYWKKAQFDGQTGVCYKGDATWAWLVNIDHLYLVNDKLDIGQHKIQSHGRGWPLTDNISDWKWKN